MNISLEEFAAGLKSLKHKARLDTHGISLDALIFLFLANPEQLVDWFNTLISSTLKMSTVTIAGLPAGKESSSPTLDKIRMLLPQPTLLGVLDFALATRINKIADRQFSCLIGSPIYIGGTPKTQTLEIAHAFQLGVEKAMDLKSHGAFLQADIAQYYDNLPVHELIM